MVVWDKRRSGTLEIIQNEFARVGYRCVSEVLNAADFGAPQARQRLFIIGSRDGERIDWPRPDYIDRNSIGDRLPTLFDRAEPKQPWRTVNEALYRRGHWRYGSLDLSKAVLWVKNVVRPHDEPVTWTLDRPAPTIGAHQSAKLAIAPHGVPEQQLLRQQWHVHGRRQGDTKPVHVEHEYLTDEELLQLQTFPTRWYLFGTRMQRAFQIGNAVPPILAKKVGGKISSAMNCAETMHEPEKVLANG
jgi:DNA (cytosine-5)-methyltransferase 1